MPFFAGHRVFTEKLEALAFMKKNNGARLKLFPSLSEVKQFCSQTAADTGSHDTVSGSSKLKVKYRLNSANFTAYRLPLQMYQMSQCTTYV